MRLFDTRIQLIKYKVLKEVIKKAYAKDLGHVYYEVPRTIIPGPDAEMRCCIYKERAIVEERIKLAMGGNKDNKNTVECLSIACDECPVDHIQVTEACRGCISHMCMETCPFDAITVINKKAVIDKSKCKECGKCLKACPYGAIIEVTRPCVRACKAKAIKIDSQKKAVIDESKCIMCGACVYQCPFGAISDKSQVLGVVDLLQRAEKKEFKVYAVIAPAIVSQFKYAKIEQVVTGIKKLGFHQVVEAALGADITLYKEAHELAEKDKMTTSCCPAFVLYIEKNFPKLVPYISSSPSPMIETARLIKKTDNTAKVVFIGPCIAKKSEIERESVKGAVDYVLTFEELQAFLDAKDIAVETLEESPLNNGSKFGRVFAKSGGISQGVKELAKEFGIEKEILPLPLNGIDECKTALLKLQMGKLSENFLEGMACEGGCINGAACLHHGAKNLLDVDKYAREAKEQSINNSITLHEITYGRKPVVG